MGDKQPASVGDENIPESLKRGTPSPNLDREQHILIRRNNPDKDLEDLDDGPDVDEETGEYRPATYPTQGGNIRRDW